jgi:hypothetical protein
MKVELEILIEQAKKQTDTFAQIKAAWERTEAEVQELEREKKKHSCNE